ncbi:hypothetical protein [Dyella telluris]|uniref:Uncharacterized protein n=1 Tax=Dyella telluris TaxID=2763498 RepID=A0A7G8Q0G8_9GAMM|nr:hypothetical protein [Dyella telluris]QNK00276.1 hypothetical protein H8F01_14280 [Dyella telluris]
MAYWRIADIPELRGLDPRSRRVRWSEAVSRSHTVRTSFLLLGVIVAAAVVVAAVVNFLPGFGAGWKHYLMLVVTWALVFGGNDLLLTQPRARRWLREHPTVMPT